MADYNDTTQLSDSIRAQYLADYMEGAKNVRLYDQLASPIGANMAELSNGSSVSVPVLSGLNPSTQTISETTDILPVQFVDTTISVTKTSLANSVVSSEKLLNNAYTNYGSQWYKKLGENMIESVDAVAKGVACAGSWWQSYAMAARASLDAGTATQRLTKSMFGLASVMLSEKKVPQFLTPRGGRWMAIMHPYAFNDLMQDAVITAVGEYQNAGMILNWELGELNGFSIVVSPWAKLFLSAGADNATAIADTLGSAATRLDKTITVASGASIVAGMKLSIGTEETGSTHYSTNEEVTVASVASKVITIIGSAENGGLRYDHASGAAVRNADHVAPVVFGSPESLAKVYDVEVGEYGELIPPYRDGSVKQFVKAGWKWYGNYSRISEARLLRAEVSLSIQA
jgi:N4-gp56 family major capsid protein